MFHLFIPLSVSTSEIGAKAVKDKRLDLKNEKIKEGGREKSVEKEKRTTVRSQTNSKSAYVLCMLEHGTVAYLALSIRASRGF